MPRKKRATHRTHLSKFLQELLVRNDVSILRAAKIAGCAPSVLHGWLQGAYPSETIDKLKKLANHYGYSLAIAMSGEPDQIDGEFQLGQHFSETPIFDGYAKIQITKLEPLRRGKNEE